MKINIIPLILYLMALITLVFLTGISQEILIVFPLGVLLAVIWFVVPCFVAVITALLSEYKLLWRALYAVMSSVAITLVLPFAQRRILLYERFDNYASLSGFLSLIQRGWSFYVRCFLILFFVFWTGEEITYAYRKEYRKIRTVQDESR